MEVIASFIFGTDADTAECFESAFNFFDRNNILYPYFNILTPIGDQWKRYLIEGRLLTVKPRLYDAHHTVFIPMKMRPIELQKGFIDLVDRVFSYDQIKKRLHRRVERADRPRAWRCRRLAQMAMYYKLLATLKMTGDPGGVDVPAGSQAVHPVRRHLDVQRPHPARSARFRRAQPDDARRAPLQPRRTVAGKSVRSRAGWTEALRPPWLRASGSL